MTFSLSANTMERAKYGNIEKNSFFCFFECHKVFFGVFLRINSPLLIYLGELFIKDFFISSRY